MEAVRPRSNVVGGRVLYYGFMGVKTYSLGANKGGSWMEVVGSVGAGLKVAIQGKLVCPIVISVRGRALVMRIFVERVCSG